MHLTILPSNIMVGDDGSVLVGAAPLDGASHQERYLAPEVQCGAEPVLPSAIYSVGALLFEAVTGHRFETRDLVTQELAGARAMARAAGLGARFWEIYLLEAAAKATEEQPEARWHSGSDFAEDLERVARERIVTRAELGRLVSEVVEARGSSLPPKQSKQSSGPPDGASRSGPPPLPKRVRRRSSQSSKQKAVSAGPKAVRAAPIPRSDGDAPQMPLITALRVPSNLKLPEGASSLGALQPAAASSAAPVIEISTGGGASKVVASSATPKGGVSSAAPKLGVSNAAPNVSVSSATPIGSAAKGGLSNAAGSASNGSASNGSASNGSAPNGSASNGSAPNGSAANGSASNGAASIGSASSTAASSRVSSGSAASGSAASGSPFSGRVNPVTLGPRLDSDLDEPTRPLRVDALEIEEPTVPRATSSAAPPLFEEPTVPRAQSSAAPPRRPEPSVEIEEPTVPRAHTSVAPVVVPSLAPPPTDQGASGESRRRTLTGTGDLRWLEGLQPPADLMDPSRHGTLLGLGNPAPTARLEPSFSEPEPPTTPMRPGPPASERPHSAPSAVSVTGAGTPYARSSTPPGSSPPSHRSSGPSSNPPASSNRMRYVHSPTLESGWDAAASEGGGARNSTGDVPFLQKRTWPGRVLLALVVLVALGIGTFEVVGHYAESDEKAAAPVAPKPAAVSDHAAKSDATPAPVAQASDAPRVVPDESEAQAPVPSSGEPEPSAEPVAVAPEAPAAPKRAAPVRRAPPRAPARATPPAKAPPAAPPRTAPAKEPDYGI